MNTDYVLSDSQRQMHRREQLKLSSMKKSWSMDSLNSLSGGSKICVCAPTTHAGSFRCRHHRVPSNSNMNQMGQRTGSNGNLSQMGQRIPSNSSLSQMAGRKSLIFEMVHEEEEEVAKDSPPKMSKLSQGPSIFEKVHEEEIEEEKVEVNKVINDENVKLAI